jgi:hypothetical protein
VVPVSAGSTAFGSANSNWGRVMPRVGSPPSSISCWAVQPSSSMSPTGAWSSGIVAAWVKKLPGCITRTWPARSETSSTVPSPRLMAT